MRLHPYAPSQYESRLDILKRREAPVLDHAMLQVSQAVALLGEMKAKGETAFKNAGLDKVYERLAVIDPEHRDAALSIFTTAADAVSQSRPGRNQALEGFTKTLDGEITRAYRDIIKSVIPMLRDTASSSLPPEHTQWYIEPVKTHLADADRYLDQLAKQLNL